MNYDRGVMLIKLKISVVKESCFLAASSPELSSTKWRGAISANLQTSTTSPGCHALVGIDTGCSRGMHYFAVITQDIRVGRLAFYLSPSFRLVLSIPYRSITVLTLGLLGFGRMNYDDILGYHLKVITGTLGQDDITNTQSPSTMASTTLPNGTSPPLCLMF